MVEYSRRRITIPPSARPDLDAEANFSVGDDHHEADREDHERSPADRARCHERHPR